MSDARLATPRWQQRTMIDPTVSQEAFRSITERVWDELGDAPATPASEAQIVEAFARYGLRVQCGTLRGVVYTVTVDPESLDDPEMLRRWNEHGPYKIREATA